MSFSFSETLADDISYYRFRLNDYDDPDEPLLSNELINALISKYGMGPALLLGCKRLCLFFGREPDKVGLTGNRSFSFKDQYRAYSELFTQLEEEYGSLGELLETGPPQMYGGLGELEFPPEVVLEFLPFNGPQACPRQPWHRPLGV